MTAHARRPAYLGGIGTMLTQSNICPTCGRIHETGLMKYVGRAVAGYPSPMSTVDPSPIGYAPIGESMTYNGPRRARPISAPWPMPPVAEEY
jgi:hypothetical protein